MREMMGTRAAKTEMATKARVVRVIVKLKKTKKAKKAQLEGGARLERNESGKHNHPLFVYARGGHMPCCVVLMANPPTIVAS